MLSGRKTNLGSEIKYWCYAIFFSSLSLSLFFFSGDQVDVLHAALF